MRMLLYFELCRKDQESPKKPKGKKPTMWDNGGKESKSLDYSGAKPDDALANGDNEQLIAETDVSIQQVEKTAVENGPFDLHVDMLCSVQGWCSAQK